MAKLNTIALSTLRNDEAYTFHQKISELALAIKSDAVKSHATNYAQKYDALRIAIDKTAGNTAAATAKEADSARDFSWQGANAYIKTIATYCPVAKLKAAAEPIYSLFKKYGNPVYLSYAAETSVIENLVESVEALGEKVIKDAAFAPWLSDLKAKQAAYKGAAKSIVDEAAAKVVGAVKDARSAADAAFTELCKVVNAFCIVIGEETFSEFISKTNVIIDKQKAVIKSRQTSAKNSAVKKEMDLT